MNIIVAIDRNGAIGRGGDLLHHISADLRRFKALTTGHCVVMGRRTFESLPKGALPNRRNIVVSRDPGFSAPGVEVARTLESAIASAGNEAFVIGGGQIYSQALPTADTLYLTVVDAVTPDADTFFPPIPLDNFRIESIERHAGEPGYTFVTMRRRGANTSRNE